MTIRGTKLAFVAVLAVTAACGNKKNDDESDTPAKPAKTSTASTASTSEAPKPTATASTQVKVEEPTPPAGVEQHVKAELDGRADGITGTAVSVGGAKASFQAPKDWKPSTKGDVEVIPSADGKTILGASSFAGDASAKATAAAQAMGMSGCSWGAPETIASGKDKLSAAAADGTCQKGTTTVHAAYVAPTAEGLVVVGTWENGGDLTNLFGSMRTIAKAAGGGDATGIAACCNALRQNAKSAPPQQAGAYMLAAGACDAIKNNPQGRAALGTVRAALAGASVPSTCK
jgi:hypothetical protein